MTQQAKVRLIIASSLLLIVVIGLALLGRHSSQNKSQHVMITGIEDCSKNINASVLDDIEAKFYGTVKSANDYNKVSSADSYQATIRSGTCKNNTSNTTDSDGKKRVIQSTTLTIDVPNAKQSWQLQYDWVTKKDSLKGIDLGTIKPTCLPKSQLQYGDFKCENIMSLVQHGTDKVDPILQYMPYTGVGFDLDYDPDTKTVTVNFNPPSGTEDYQAYNENTKAIIPYWFQKRGLDQSKYKVVYSSDIDGSGGSDGSDDN